MTAGRVRGGAVEGSIALARLPEAGQPHAGRALFGGVALFGAAVIVVALSGSFALSLAAPAVVGAGDALSVFVRATIIPLRTPPEKPRGVSAVHLLLGGAAHQLGGFR